MKDKETVLFQAYKQHKHKDGLDRTTMDWAGKVSAFTQAEQWVNEYEKQGWVEVMRLVVPPFKLFQATLRNSSHQTIEIGVSCTGYTPEEGAKIWFKP